MPVPRQLIPRQWIIPKGPSRERIAQQVATFVAALDFDKGWRVTVEEHRPTRSNAQNAYLNGVAYKLLGDSFGYERDDISEYLCGVYFGERQKRVPKSRRNPEGLEWVPLRTTTTDADGKRSVLNKQEFSDYVAFVQRFGAKHGVHIPDPGEMPEEQERAA
jgi:hypothetical protein